MGGRRLCCLAIFFASFFFSFLNGIVEENGNALLGEGELSDPEYFPYIGNGYLAVRFRASYFHVGGLYNGYNGQSPPPTSHRVDIPSPLLISFSTSSQEMALNLTLLDLQNATVTSTFVSSDDNIQVIEQEIFAHSQYRNLFVNHIQFGSRSSDSLVDLLFNETTSSDDYEIIASNFTANQWCWSAQTIFTETVKINPATFAVCMTPIPNAIYANSSSLTLLTTVRTDLVGDVRESGEVLQQCQEDFQHFSSLSYENLKESHVSGWQNRWSEGGIDVEGNFTFASQLNSSYYYLLSSLRDDWPYGISPGGLSTNGYNGHVFWDQDTWMAPSLLPFFTHEVKGLMQYRILRLGSSTEKAREYAYQGAWYPWESAYTGVECCPNPSVNTEGLFEIHINGDVAMMIRQYYYATLDTIWLRKAFPVLFQLSRFWGSRMTTIEKEGEVLYTALNVQPPDESAGKVNSSIYTNVIAGMTLNFTMEAEDILNISFDSSEREKWTQIANNIYLPKKNISGVEIHNEYDGYDGHIINQADVGLLQYPLHFPMSKEIAIEDLLYWQNKTDPNGYFTGDSSYSISWLQLNDLKRAQVEFDKSFSHMDSHFNVWKEKLSGGHINFLTGAGGFLQNVIYGYGGVFYSNNSMYFYPRLPDTGISSMRFRKILFSSAKFDITFDTKEIEIKLVENSSQNMNYCLLNSQGTQTLLTENTPISQPLTFFYIILC